MASRAHYRTGRSRGAVDKVPAPRPVSGSCKAAIFWSCSSRPSACPRCSEATQRRATSPCRSEAKNTTSSTHRIRCATRPAERVVADCEHGVGKHRGSGGPTGNPPPRSSEPPQQRPDSSMRPRAPMPRQPSSTACRDRGVALAHVGDHDEIGLWLGRSAEPHRPPADDWVLARAAARARIPGERRRLACDSAPSARGIAGTSVTTLAANPARPRDRAPPLGACSRSALGRPAKRAVHAGRGRVDAVRRSIALLPLDPRRSIARRSRYIGGPTRAIAGPGGPVPRAGPVTMWSTCWTSATSTSSRRSGGRTRHVRGHRARVGLSATAVHERVRKLEQSGVIRATAPWSTPRPSGSSSLRSSRPRRSTPGSPTTSPTGSRSSPRSRTAWSVAGEASYVLKVRTKRRAT